MFTKIPQGWNAKALWNVFAKCGKTTDVYIPKKKTVSGKDFGFAKFLKVVNIKEFENILNTILIGTHNLKFYVAKYQRNSIKPTPNSKPPKPFMTATKALNPTGKLYHSYVEVLQGRNSSQLSLNETSGISIDLPSYLLVKLKFSLIGKLKNIHSGTNIPSIRKEEYLQEIKVNNI